VARCKRIIKKNPLAGLFLGTGPPHYLSAISTPDGQTADAVMPIFLMGFLQFRAALLLGALASPIAIQV
jgi:hypothetical protein